MITVEASTTINRSVEEVFLFLTDTDYQSQYDNSLLSVKRMPAGPMQPGTQIMETRKIMGHQIESFYEVVEYEPYSRYVGKSIGGTMVGTGTRSFRSTPKGTRVSWNFNFVQEGFAAVLAPLFGRVLKKALDKDLAIAKSLLESGVKVG